MASLSQDIGECQSRVLGTDRIPPIRAAILAPETPQGPLTLTDEERRQRKEVFQQLQIEADEDTGQSIHQRHQQLPPPTTTEFSAALVPSRDQDNYIIDSGASRSILNDIRLFESYQPLQKPLIMTTSSGLTHIGEGKGPALIRVCRLDGTERLIRLEEAIFNPQSPFNILSTGQLRNMGLHLESISSLLMDSQSQEVGAVDWRYNVPWIRIHRGEGDP